MSSGHCRCDKAGASLAQLVLFIELSLSELNRFFESVRGARRCPFVFSALRKAGRTSWGTNAACSNTITVLRDRRKSLVINPLFDLSP